MDEIKRKETAASMLKEMEAIAARMRELIVKASVTRKLWTTSPGLHS